TGAPLDLAINKDSFFQVQLPDGRTAYTRDGNWKSDVNGLVVNNDGYPLVPNVTIQPGSRAITISATGKITAILPGNNDPTEIGEINIATFSNPSGLTRIGQN